MLTVKGVLSQLFHGVKFDTALYKKILHNNVECITSSKERTSLFGGKLIGNHTLKYTMYDKNIFYSNLFDMSYEEVSEAVDTITTIKKSYKIARDDINLVCFYIAHRFLTNDELSKDKQIEYAKEILNYFSYRTLILLTATYFIYPISTDKAQSLSERLSNRYIIKQLKNWNEYCQYRSEEFVNSKLINEVIKLNDDAALPNVITDLYNRTKDTLKNIYGELVDMLEHDEVIKSRKNLANDAEGTETILDKINTPDSYFTKIEAHLTDKSSFVRKDVIDLTTEIINTVSYTQVYDLLVMTGDYSFKSKDNNIAIKHMVRDILSNAIAYLAANNVHAAKNSNVASAVNALVGNILYARGTDVEVNDLKEMIDKTIKKVYKDGKYQITDRNLRNSRNAFYVYIVLLALLT